MKIFIVICKSIDSIVAFKIIKYSIFLKMLHEHCFFRNTKVYLFPVSIESSDTRQNFKKTKLILNSNFYRLERQQQTLITLIKSFGLLWSLNSESDNFPPAALDF